MPDVPGGPDHPPDVPGHRRIPALYANGAPADLGATTWPQVEAVIAHLLLVVPLGATEQHGPCLPLATDTLIAEGLCAALARRRSDVVVAPAVPYGASGEHAAFPGTLSLGTGATARLLVELVRSADAFRGVVLVCAHGGNADALVAAARQLDGEGRLPLVWAPSPVTLEPVARAHGAAVDAHAGWVETSMLLALDPGAVRHAGTGRGVTEPLAALAGRLRRHGVRAVSPTGVLGDPAGATAAAGRALLDALAGDLDGVISARWGPPTP